MTLGEACTSVDGRSQALKADEVAARTFTLLNSPSDIGNALYSVGFLGIKDSVTMRQICS